MTSDPRPIGVFDSGIGGLTIAHGLVNQLPNESILYFGDTQHLPYGDKSDKTVKRYAHRISKFLIDKGCKAIVIACNTASALAFESVRGDFPNLPVFNVVDPVVEAVAASGKRHVGVIGTRSTIGSGIYAKKIKSIDAKIKVSELATPLLAPMIEEGYHTKTISSEVIASYLSNRILEGIDELILGCTHYPLIKEEIDKYYNSKVVLIDSPVIVAKTVKEELTKMKALATNEKPYYSFFVSDLTHSFAESASRFFEQSITLKACRLWDKNGDQCV